MLENMLLKGLCIGILFGVPVGAVGALTVQRTSFRATLLKVTESLKVSLRTRQGLRIF